MSNVGARLPNGDSASDRRRDLTSAAIIMMSAFLASRLTGLARTIATSYQFGTGREYDAYVAAIRIPDFIFQVIAAGAVASAFIPVFTGYLVREDRDSGWRMVSTLFNLALLVLIPLCIFIAVFARPIMGWIYAGFEPETIDQATSLTRILLATPVIFALGTFSTSVLQSHKRFFLPALAPSMYNLGLIAGALVLAPWFGIHGLAFGAVAGALMYLGVQVPGLIKCGMSYVPILDLRHQGVRRLGKLMLPRTLGLAVAQINLLVISALASAEPGAIAALDYAWQVTMLPLGIFAMAISTAVFPTLADQSARDQLDDMRRTMSGTLRLILFLTIPSCAGLVVLATPIVRLLFERGAFDPGSTALTVLAVRFFALGIFGHAMVEIITRAFYALEDTRTPVAVAAASMLVSVSLALVLRSILGFGGLALALSIAAVFEAAVLGFLAAKRLGSLDEDRLIASAARILVATIGMAIVLFLALDFLERWVTLDTLGGQLLTVALGVTVGGGVYLALAALLGAEEVARLRTSLKDRRAPARS
ncbi:MAG TPA: murein biosynthesis integral membrane protein MurJ [Chloroflexota bacterium]|nr:murein biosynthesis integral membrane protein MurJ [Chloroflexota bacterium]